MSDSGMRVRNAPRLVGAALVGTELGSPSRRAAALVVDLVLWLVVAFPAVMGLGLLRLMLQLGGPQVMRDLSGGEPSAPEQRAAWSDAKLRFVRILEESKPDALSPALLHALGADDEEALRALVDETELSVNVQLSSGPVESGWDEETGEITIRNDVLFGTWNRWLGLVPLFVLGFTLVLRALKGWTPGKWLFGVRVVRTSGGPLRLWDCFSRAGGYLGSLGMLGLGFLEVLWDPNRQAAHDKLAGTFVVRAPRFRAASASDDGR